MAKDKAHQLDYKGLAVVADEFIGTVTGTITGGALKPTGVANIATADAVDPATTMALVNICKAKINELLTALKA